MFKYSIALLATLATPVVLVPEGGRDRQAEVRFNRDVRPILADRCFACHGPDAKARKAKLRLDTREGALAAREAGAAVVPGDPEASLLIQRVRHADAEERMPPRAKGERLTDEEIATLTRWVEQGARWEGHWAFEPIGTVQLPARPSAFIRNDVDRLLAQRIAEVGMRPAPPADARDLIRRLYFDLIGLPPTPGQVREFVADPSDARFEEVVDDLLASEQHAERLAMYWLDLVRYADTSGIHGDQDISMSPYRDWVIRSFHENKPFDVFTRQQLAGDLLPDPSIQDRVASGYNRLNMKTSEGGAQPEEYLAKYAADRVRTTATVWLGLTLGCAECHDHKFDPFTTRDFYRFAAFFADLDQKGFYPGSKWTPKIAVPSQAQEKEHGRLMQRVEELERLVATHTPELSAAQAQWEEDTKAAVAKAQRPLLGPWSSIGPFKGGSNRGSFDKDFGPEKNPGSELLAVGELAWVARPSCCLFVLGWVAGDPSKWAVARLAGMSHPI